MGQIPTSALMCCRILNHWLLILMAATTVRLWLVRQCDLTIDPLVMPHEVVVQHCYVVWWQFCMMEVCGCRMSNGMAVRVAWVIVGCIWMCCHDRK